MKKKRSAVFRTCVTGVTAVATSLTIGLAAACSTKDTTPDDEDTTVARVDEQLVKNGDFEYYSDNKGLYPISNPDNWTGGTTGNSSASMSGIIDTKKERWDYITNPEFPKTLEDNNDLKSDNKDKKDYNGALTDDLPYKDPHAATATDAKDEDKVYINNPFTHEYRYDSEGKVLNNKNEEVTTYKNEEDGRLYLDSEYKTPFKTSVLMLHNYRSSYYTGTESYFKSSTTLTLKANTAAAISLWVKTCDLYFDGADSTRTAVNDSRGAYIKVDTEVGGHDMDSFTIKNINTEKLVETPMTGEGEDKQIDWSNWENNGWVQYTVYVEASTFADTTVNLTLGLGEDDIYTVEGYAFFDDITFTQYVNAAEMRAAEENAAFADKIDAENTAKPLSPDAKMDFRVDKRSYKQNDADGKVIDVFEDNNSADRHFFIDFTSSTGASPIELGPTTVSTGLTVEETSTGKFTSAKYAEGNKYAVDNVKDNGATAASIPSKLGVNGIDVTGDLISAVTIDGNNENWKFKEGYGYSDVLTPELITASGLPGVDNKTTQALVVMSAMGASYETELTNDAFVLGDGEFALISFWVKTSDLSSGTAATVTVSGVSGDDLDNKGSFTIDSTTQTAVNINDEKDVYKGWVNCFVKVSNKSGDGTERAFKIKVNYGTTTIRGTTRAAYKSGWLAVANVSMIKIDEDVYGYTSDLAHSAALSFTEKATNNSHIFDTEDGEKNVINDDLAIPSSYTGMNGGSTNVIPSFGDTTVYDETNKNKIPESDVAFTGLLNKENLDSYKDKIWFADLSNIENLGGKTPEEVWNGVFGEYSLQPLLILNTPRKFNDKTQIYNYGYRGKSLSVSADGYTAVSVRVKVSDGAKAYVYLTEDTAKSGSKILSYSLPEYNFWYDSDGNILKGKPSEEATTSAQKKENIAYKLRKDGLYEREGKLYANFYNLSKYYDIKYEHESFYNENKELVPFDKLEQGKTYYADANLSKLAPHYLIAGNKSNNKVYEYVEGKDGEVCYYYMENGKANTSKKVYCVDTAVASLRYDYSKENESDYQYVFEIDNTNGEYTGKWITATFYIHAGSEEKNYRLELWSGERDKQTSYEGVTDNSYVIFDYSSISLDQSTYDGLVNKYVEDISAAYREAITEELKDNNANLSELQQILGNKLGLYDYIARYYTFSLYDSAAFIPFNGETSEDGNGYSFDYSESKESIAFLKVRDMSDSSNTLSAFIDYSVLDKDIEIIGEPTAPDNPSEEPSNTTGSNFWLLFASIALVVVILVAIAAIFIRDLIKKRKRSKTAGKNSYNFNKNKRYVKKYVKANGDVEAPVDEGEVDQSLLSDATNEAEAPAEAEQPEQEPKAEEAPSTEEPAEGAAEEKPEESSETDGGEKTDEAKGQDGVGDDKKD